MKLGKKTSVLGPKPCYMLFELDKEFNLSNQREESGIYISNEIMYSGPIKIFLTLKELNNHLAQKEVINKTIDNRLYKGHIFPAKEFPLETENKKNITFVIEKIDNDTCFAEQVVSLNNAAESIEEEINMLLGQTSLNELKVNEIADYMVFHGKNVPLSYYCYDFDI